MENSQQKNKSSEVIKNPDSRYDLLIIFFTAFVIRTVLLILSVDQIGLDAFWSTSIDTVNYFKIADDFIQGTNSSENYIHIFGPGFGVFLAVIMSIFKHHILPLIMINMALSCITCCMSYILAFKLFHDRIIALLSAIMMVFSYTSISLSILLLSDTLYLFLFVLSVILFLKGFEKLSFVYFIISGLLMGYTILIRSVGQFWFLGYILIILYNLDYCKFKHFKTFLKSNSAIFSRGLITVLIIFLTIFLWSLRNFNLHDVMVLSSRGAEGLANVAAFSTSPDDLKSFREIRKEWLLNYAQENNIENLSIKQIQDIHIQKSKEILFSYPQKFLHAYFLLVWENINEINSLNRTLLPEFKPETIFIEKFIRKYYLNYSGFIFSIIGMIILIIKKRYKNLLILSLIYFYYAAMVGSFRWQGSRLFLPAEIASSILISSLIVYSFQYLKRLLKNIFSFLKKPSRG